MKFFFVERVKTIWEVAKRKGVSVDFAFDMFYADVVNGAAHSYNTALDAYDFAADKAAWEALTEDVQKSARAIYKDFIVEKYDEICKAWDNDDMDAIDAIVEKYKAVVEARAEKANDEAAEVEADAKVEAE